MHRRVPHRQFAFSPPHRGGNLSSLARARIRGVVLFNRPMEGLLLASPSSNFGQGEPVSSGRVMKLSVAEKEARKIAAPPVREQAQSNLSPAHVPLPTAYPCTRFQETLSCPFSPLFLHHTLVTPFVPRPAGVGPCSHYVTRLTRPDPGITHDVLCSLQPAASQEGQPGRGSRSVKR